MAPTHFLIHRLRHVLDIKAPLTGAGNIGVEEHLVQHIPEFLFDVLGVSLFDGVDQFVSLFNQKRQKRFVGLFPVPGTSVLPAKGRHRLNQTG